MSALIAANLPWLQALGWSLLHFIWQGALVGIVYGVVRRAVPNRLSEVRYAAGLVAMLVLALCPLLTMAYLLGQTAAVESIAAVSLADADTGFAIASAVQSGLGIDALLPWLVLAWGVGVIGLAARTVRQWRALEIIATRMAERDHAIDAMFAALLRRFGGYQRVKVLVSRCIDTPTLIGWFNPVILLPTAVVLGFPRHQLELILAHELGHLRRYDHLANLGQVIVETVLFYHPVVHWISRDVRHEREICCDDLVLRLTQGEPREYARTLAALEDLRQLSPQLAVAASGGVLVERIRRIVGLPSSTPGTRRRGHAGWVLVAVTAVVASISLWVLDAKQTDDATPGAAATLEPLQRPLLARPQLQLLPQAQPAPLVIAPLARIEVSALEAAQPVTPAAETSSPAAVQAALPVTMASASGTAPVVVVADAPAADDARAENVSIPEPVQVAVVAAPGPAAAGSMERGARKQPTVVRRVAPHYPDVINARTRGHVEFEFSIDDSGAVRDIAVVDGDTLGSFTVAARRALRQWRFYPHSAEPGERYRQDFVFVDANEGVDDTNCARGTGSHICRAPRGVSIMSDTRLGALPDATRPIASADDTARVDNAN